MRHPPELEIDIARAWATINLERKDRPDFVPTLSFLQRRLRWGFFRASQILPHVKEAKP